MQPLLPVSLHNDFARSLTLRDPDRLFRDESLRPDPVYMSLRKVLAAVRRMFGARDEVDVAPAAEPRLIAQSGCGDEPRSKLAA